MARPAAPILKTQMSSRLLHKVQEAPNNLLSEEQHGTAWMRTRFHRELGVQALQARAIMRFATP
jgi:hypothetical protein